MRYIVDKRNGCAAVIDTEHEGYAEHSDRSNGPSMADPWVLHVRNGYRVRHNNNQISWNMEISDVKWLEGRCEDLNKESKMSETQDKTVINIRLSLDKAREMYEPGKDTPFNQFLIENFSKEELEKKEVTCWEDLGKIEGWYLTDESCAMGNSGDARFGNQNVWATREQAEASLAMSMLSQLMANVNGDWVPDWEDKKEKYVAYMSNNKLSTDICWGNSNFLVFETSEIRDKFANTHKSLILKAAPLL